MEQNYSQKKSLNDKTKGSVGIPYIPNVSERIRRCLQKFNVNTYFVPQNKLRQHLVHPKDKIKKEDCCGVVYQVDCSNCKQAYIGETGRSLSTRIKEHKTDVTANCTGIRTRSARSSASEVVHNSAITDHMTIHTHTPNWNSVSILAK